MAEDEQESTAIIAQAHVPLAAATQVSVSIAVDGV